LAKEESFEHLFRRYRRDAVLLHHPYPPYAGPRTNSKFGGLPTLPANVEWPRSSDGTPLHFFAQVDCADIGFRTELPERGVLFFFGRDDGEQSWSLDDPGEDSGVLYALDSGTTLREAPADLPPIGGYYPGAAWRDYLREGERGPTLHVEWPIQPLPIDTWPDALYAMPDEPDPKAVSFVEYGLHLLGRTPKRSTWQEVEARGKRYKEQLERHKAAAFAKATGEQWDIATSDYYDQIWTAGRAIFDHAEHGPEAYPQHWIAIHYAVRALLPRPAWFGSDPLAEEWLQRSNEAGLDEPMSEADRSAFRAWLTKMERPYDECPLSKTGRELVVRSLVATIRAWAGDPERAARLGPHVYAAMRFHFGGASVWGWQYAQMLGHAPSAQTPQPVDNTTICLLNLATDPALGWMFGDVGNCTFWIEPEDLARRDFSKVLGVIEGG
jgi:Domain of unknown function (DUF1963)